MTLILAFLAAIIAVALWWLLREGVASKPWLETGAPEAAATLPPGFDAGRVGLFIFLVVVGALFTVFGSAFVMRMELELWTSFRLPGIVWVNTAQLVFAGLFLHLATRAGQRGDRAGLRRDAAIAGLATLGFLLGQLLAWRLLTAAGEGLAAGPATSFFYLLSGLHGLHILGGLAALGLVLVRRSQIGVGLCATYWNFMLVVWVGLLALFLGWANQLAEICRSILL